MPETQRTDPSTDLRPTTVEHAMQMVLSSVADFIALFDLDGRLLFANDGMLKRWEVPLESVVGRTLVELGYDSATAASLQADIQRVIDTRTHVRSETGFTVRDGRTVEYEYLLSPVFAPDGTVRAVTGVTRDITAHKRVEDALRESEARFRNMSDHAPVMIWVTRADGYCEYLNRLWYDFTGQSEEAARGFGWLDAVHPDDIERANLVFRDAVATRSQFQIEYRLRRRDGEYRYCIDAAAPRFGRDGTFLGFIGSVVDLTERKRAEDAAHQSEQQMRALFQQMTAGIAQVDLTGRFLEVNERYCEITGRSADDLLGRKMQEITAAEDLSRNLVLFESMVRTGQPYIIEKRYVRPDGSHIWVSNSVSLVNDAHGRPDSIVAVVVDITERKRIDATHRELTLERERVLADERAAREEAERASRMKDEFLATLSHELRTPLNAILGWSQIARTQRPEDVARGLEVIERNARAQTQIVEDLLDMSSIINGRIRLEVQRVDLPAIVRAAMETARPAAEARGIALTAVIDPLAGVCVRGDAGRLQQVLWNLLSNAIKFTPRNGTVRVLLEQVDSHLEIRVVDSGEGIAPEFLPYVFDRFRQADASSTRRHGGLGLGLSIAKQLVELHGGTIQVQSGGLGKGATFVVSLPVMALRAGSDPGDTGRHPHVSAAAAIRAAPDVDIDGVRVLVVDDENDARTLVKQILETCGAEATTASSADEALALLAARPFDVLVSDIGMPGEDGYGLIKRVRSLGHAPVSTIPAVALTAYARSEDRMKAIAAGYQLHVSKPVEPAELITMVAGAAGRTGR